MIHAAHGALGHRIEGLGGQRLQIAQDGAAALQGAEHHAAAGTPGPLAQQGLAGIGHRHHALGAHFKHAQLVDGAEAVFHGAQEPVLVLAVAFEVQHRVHHVLQHTGAGQTAFLGDVAHDEGGRAAFLGVADDGPCALAHLPGALPLS